LIRWRSEVLPSADHDLFSIVTECDGTDNASDDITWYL
jgi:hypothetical protein